jgi:ribosomal protein L20
MRKNTTNVMRCLSLWIKRINIVETKISYSNVISYMRTDGEGKLDHV